MNQEDHALFNQKMTAGTKNVILGANAVFGTNNCHKTIEAANRFAKELEGLLSQAPLYTPQLEDNLDHSRESVRQFIKTASELYGNISLTLESV
ncbi:hypothetical protein M9Y10_020219 [Tritrichomonas musculus]|uniref:Uncharacterized protein n=1 Tax=Tritrichomonas musculus TaxID=1915356 RepID=A0ABR2HGH8_9EUKA